MANMESPMSPMQKQLFDFLKKYPKKQEELPFLWKIHEPSDDFCEALWSYFHDVKQVSINMGYLEESSLEEIDSIVVVGNRGGFFEKDSKTWNHLNRFVGENNISKIREYIVEHFYGEAPAFVSFVISLEHEKLKNIVYVTHMRSSPQNIYFCIWSALLKIREHNQEHPENAMKGLITSGLTPLLSTASAIAEARQMYIAYMNLFSSPKDMDIQILHAQDKLMNELLTDSNSDRSEEFKTFFLHKVREGAIEKRGFLSYSLLEMLVSILCHDMSLETDVELKEAIARVITQYTYIGNPKQEFADLVSEKCLDYLLELALLGKVKAYNEINMNEVEKGELVSDPNTLSKVYRGTWRNRIVAVKEFITDGFTFSEQDFQREVVIMSMLRHQNILPLIGACHDGNRVILLSEFVEGGTLRHMLDKSDEDFPIKQQVTIALQIALGLAYLHSKNVIHRDIKSPNILVDGEIIRICDLGSSRRVARGRKMTSMMGTGNWMAPEIFHEREYDIQSDIYSFGMVLWEIVSRKMPFDDLDEVKARQAVVNGDKPEIPNSCHPELERIIKLCWRDEPSKRPTSDQLVQMLSSLINAVNRTESFRMTADEQKQVHKRIEKEIKKTKKMIQSSKRELQILMLGTSDSGKSTIAKQMKILHINGYSKKERLQFKPFIERFVFHNMRILIKSAEENGIDIQSKSEATTILNSSSVLNKKTFIAMTKLWNDQGIQKTLQTHLYQGFDDNVLYFFNKLKSLVSLSYVPTDQDILLCRTETTGVVETRFQIGDQKFCLIDVAGSRGSRKKWISLFSNQVTAILFVVALSEYNLTLQEDATTNRMHESLKVFEEVVNSKELARIPTILFLNKRDIFDEKIKRFKLQTCFPEYDENGKYTPIDYIRRQFMKTKKGNNYLYVHFTTAVDTKNVDTVFSDLKDHVLRRAMEDLSLQHFVPSKMKPKNLFDYR